MSKYTVQLRNIVESVGDSAGQYSEKTYDRIGLSSYPIFDEDYRETLNNKIIDHFFFKEIGFETVSQFAFYMRRTMNEIMPYYNQLYESEGMITDPLVSKNGTWSEEWRGDTSDRASHNNTVTLDGSVRDTGSVTLTLDTETVTDTDMTTTDNGTNSDTTVDTTTANARNVFSDTPMGMLDELDGMGTVGASLVSQLKYATTVTYDDSSKNGNTTHNGTNANTNVIDGLVTVGEGGTRTTVNDLSKTTDDTTTDVGWNVNDRNDSGRRLHEESGFDVPQADLLLKYRKTFINIDMMIIGDLEDLFLGLW